jgi:hypothetical protein
MLQTNHLQITKIHKRNTQPPRHPSNQTNPRPHRRRMQRHRHNLRILRPKTPSMHLQPPPRTHSPVHALLTNRSQHPPVPQRIQATRTVRSRRHMRPLTHSRIAARMPRSTLPKPHRTKTTIIKPPRAIPHNLVTPHSHAGTGSRRDGAAGRSRTGSGSRDGTGSGTTTGRSTGSTIIVRDGPSKPAVTADALISASAAANASTGTRP